MTALSICADPVLTTVHLLEHSSHHAWCEVHQHVIHVDPEAELVGSPSVSVESVWDTSEFGEEEYDECAALTALRAELARAPRLTLQTPESDELLPLPALRFEDGDVLSRAPKQGPPASA